MSQRANIRKINYLLKKVNMLADRMKALSDDELKGLTPKFRERLENGEKLDALLPEAFAAMREADRRVLGKFPYDVQVMGGIGLHLGMLCEMNTGEGKTLTATMPLYLNSISGKGSILVTTNSYLALRDCEEMGPVYRFMGLTVACAVTEHEDEKLTNAQKKKIYDCDIVYTTNSSLGFDYLFNNLVKSVEDRFMNRYNYVIVDEADAVLLDAAQMPLIIAGSPRVQSNMYKSADFFVRTLKEEEDYIKEENKVWLTEKGIERAEKFFRIGSLYDEKWFEINRAVNLSLKAHVLLIAGKDYVVSDKGEVVLLDAGSGRMMPGVKLKGGIHQAIEVKEGINPSQETRSVASVTYPNLFSIFDKLAGMSGTISDTKDEIRSIYGLDTVVIPTNNPVIRKDMHDEYYTNKEEQFADAINEALTAHDTGQPVLIVVGTMKETEYVSDRLIKAKVPHNVLNANNAFWEAAIIKEAGIKGAVTVATSMAGRGTDIKLGPGVKDLGGLHVIGIGRMANVRLERQARGRAGRQGDPGFSRFFVSLEDEVVINALPDDELEKFITGKKRIGKRALMNMIDGAQKLTEENAETTRKRYADYDKILKKQRLLIYSTRNNLLDGAHVNEDMFLSIAKEVIKKYLKENKKPDRREINRYILDNISYQLDDDAKESMFKHEKMIYAYLIDKVRSNLENKKQMFESEERFNEFIRRSTLTSIDNEWVEEVDYLGQLQNAVTGRSTAQRNPVFEYQNDALESYRRMEDNVYKNIMRNVLLSTVTFDDSGKMSVTYP